MTDNGTPEAIAALVATLTDARGWVAQPGYGDSINYRAEGVDVALRIDDVSGEESWLVRVPGTPPD